MRCLVHVRSMFSNINSIVLPQQKSIHNAGKAFKEDGSLVDAKQEEEVKNLGRGLAKFLSAYKSKKL